MPDQLRLLMIGAMYENGGNTTHRLLDGHPELYVYPFESQLGTKFVNDHLSSMFPLKYRWPSFTVGSSPRASFFAIIDEECRVRSRTPHVSKFRHVEFDMSDDERAEIFAGLVEHQPPTRGGYVTAFFQSTFQAWRNFNASGRETVYVGYSPIVGVDAGKMLVDLPDSHFLHIVRNPWSAYADTKKRPVPLSLSHYMMGWVVNQHLAQIYSQEFPDRFHLVRIEDVMADPQAALGPVCRAMGLTAPSSLSEPSWNGQPLAEVYPWGTIRTPTPEANLATARELDEQERVDVRRLAGPFLEALGYASLI